MAADLKGKTIKILRDLGHQVQNTEHWNPFSKRKEDFGGFADCLSWDGHGTIAHQVTSSAHLADRRTKILGSIPACVWATTPGNRILLWAWRKKAGQWEYRTQEIGHEDFPSRLRTHARLARGGFDYLLPVSYTRPPRAPVDQRAG